MRYTKQFLEPIVARNTCVVDVVREIGVPASGGNSYHIGRMIKKHGIDTSHFDISEARGRWLKNGNPNKRKTADEILVYGRVGNRRERGLLLARAMQDKGIQYLCSACGLGKEWNAKPISLEVEHINNDWLDNRLNNLCFLCPNCHSQKPVSPKRTHKHSCIYI
jgi:hypothetical protein